jgi:LasA protease
VTNRKLLLIFVLGILCANAQGDGLVLTESDLIYTNEQMLNFNIEEYLRTYAPHLLPYAESISHWAGFSSISPKVLLALMEYQSSIISFESSAGMSRPFATLSETVGFNEQLKDVSNQLAELHYKKSSSVNRPISVVRLLSDKKPSHSALKNNASELSKIFSRIYYRLFPVVPH